MLLVHLPVWRARLGRFQEAGGSGRGFGSKAPTPPHVNRHEEEVEVLDTPLTSYTYLGDPITELLLKQKKGISVNRDPRVGQW